MGAPIVVLGKQNFGPIVWIVRSLILGVPKPGKPGWKGTPPSKLETPPP